MYNSAILPTCFAKGGGAPPTSTGARPRISVATERSSAQTSGTAAHGTHGGGRTSVYTSCEANMQQWRGFKWWWLGRQNIAL
jgi:hypothetical protein